MFKCNLKFLLLFLVCFNVLAFDYSDLDVEYFHISQWKISNSIGKTVIGDLVYDGANNIVLATSDGVKTFDGARFVDYYPYGSTPNNVSFGKIYFTSEYIWAANSHGVFRLDSIESKNVNIELNYNIYSSLALLNNSSVWFVSDFNLFSINTNSIKPSKISDIKSTSIHISVESSRIFLGSRGFVYELDTNGKVIDKVTLPDTDLVVISLHLTKENILLINTNQGTFLYNTITKTISQDIIGVAARMVYEDSKGRLWFGTNKGIFLYENSILKRINLPVFQDLRIRGITEDKYGNIWFGTWGEGLFRLKNTPFELLKSDVNPNSYLETKDKIKWLGGYNGVSVVHQGNRITPDVVGIENVAVYDIEKGEADTVWVAYKSDLVQFDVLGESQKIVTDIDAMFYKFLQIDEENKLWVGTENGLFYKTLGTDKHFIKLELPNNEDIGTLILLKNNKILIVTDKNVYVFANGVFTQDNMTRSLQPSNLVLTYDNVLDVIWYYDAQNNLLIKVGNDEVWSFTLDKILAQFSFYNIVSTSTNDLVLLGENGIVRIRGEWLISYNDKEPLFFEMLAMPGLEQNECNGGNSSIVKNSSGEIFFTCKSGVLSLNSTSKKPLFLPADMKVTLEVDGKKTKNDSATLTLSPGERSYHFTFASNSLDVLFPLEYRYRLSGVDKQWNYVNSTSRNTVVYANIKPGYYEFEAQVKTSNSSWSGGSNNIVDFIVTHYYYQKPWFAYIIGIAFIILYIINDYFRGWRYNKETQKLSKLVEEKTESLKQVQKRELQREQKSREILNHEIEKKSKKLEQQMLLTLEKEKQLQEIQKMEVVGQLTSGIAHDFNNMLSVIFIGSEVIKKDLEKNKQGQCENLKWLDNILLTAENCRDVIGQLLKFTRKNNEKSSTFCIHNALTGILSLIKIGIPETIQFNMNFSKKHAFITADLSQFNQIILNLIINARNACGDYGEITITTEIIDDEDNSRDCIFCQNTLNNACVEIVISDTGTGVPDDLMEHIFKPFFSTSSDAQSAGLGLHIVNSNIHQMGGHIQVAPNSDRGMSFKVLLPLVQSEPISPTVKTKFSLDRAKSKNVLLVEDSASLVELICLIFDDHKINYDVGKNGIEGIDLFYQNPNKYDLILTDNSMPEMNGIDMSEKILSEFPNTNIVLLTGDINNSVVQECKNIGVCEVFLKPIKSDELIKLVNSYTTQI